MFYNIILAPKEGEFFRITKGSACATGPLGGDVPADG